MSRSRRRRHAAVAATVGAGASCPVPEPQHAEPAVNCDWAAPSHEDVAVRAREIWESRGCPEGHDLEIWLAAEGELREQVR